MTTKSAYFLQYLGPDVEYAQCEVAGICIRIGNRALVFGRWDYRDATCPWPMWARFRLVLGHKPYPHWGRRWSLMAFGRRYEFLQRVAA